MPKQSGNQLLEISIAEITTDETDPALIRLMVIRPGGVKNIISIKLYG